MAHQGRDEKKGLLKRDEKRKREEGGREREALKQHEGGVAEQKEPGVIEDKGRRRLQRRGRKARQVEEEHRGRQ